MWKGVKLEGAAKSHVSVGQFVTSQFLTQNALDDPSSVNPTVGYFHEKLDEAKHAEARLRKRLDFLHKLESQLALLLNKTLTERYGESQRETHIAAVKSVVPPLPPGNQPKLGDILRVLHNITPDSLKEFLERSKSVDFAVFGEGSIFDDSLLNSVLRAAHDSQIAFLEGVVAQTKACGDFMRTLLSLLSEISLAPEIRRELTDPRSDYDSFLKFYQKTLMRIAKLAGAESCKLVFTTAGEKELVFPIDGFTYLLDVNDSLTGFALKQTGVVRIDDPKNREAFESVSERELFEVNDPVIFVPFGVCESKVSGLLVFAKSTRFSETDAFVVKVIADFLSPALKLFRDVFVDVSPRDIGKLMRSIAEMRGDVNLFEELKKKICSLTSAGFCKFFSTGSYPYYEGVPVLPYEPSLIRRSKDANIHFAYHNPRTVQGFNPQVDDELSLAKITSMLVAPVKGTPLMIVLYNATKSNFFTQVQSSLAVLFAASLAPLVHEYTFTHQMDQITKLRAGKRQALVDVHAVMPPLLESVYDGRFFETINGLLPEGVMCSLFLFVNETDAFRVPDNNLVRATQNMLSAKKITVVEKEICHDIECMGNSEIKSLLIIPECRSRVLCIFGSREIGTFSSDENTYLARLASVLLLLLPSYVHRHQLIEIQARHEKIQKVTELAMANLSAFVGTDIDCHFFETPLEQEPELGKAMTISIETPRGIEAALTSPTPIQSSTAKDAIVSFAEWMSSILASKAPEEEPNPELVSFFTGLGLEPTFACTTETMNAWFTKVSVLFESNGISMIDRPSLVSYVSKLLSLGRWSKWFTADEKLILCLLTYLTDLDKIWRCRVDDRLNEEALGCRPVAGPFLACLFGKGFGLADSLSSDARKPLISIVNDFAVDGTVQCQTQVLARIKLIASQGIKCSPESKKWVGKALVLLSSTKTFADGSEEVIEEARGWPDDKQLHFIFTMEKVYIPMITLLARGDDTILDIIGHNKRAVRLLRMHKKM